MCKSDNLRFRSWIGLGLVWLGLGLVVGYYGADKSQKADSLISHTSSVVCVSDL